jgi:hypothetical protein
VLASGVEEEKMFFSYSSSFFQNNGRYYNLGWKNRISIVILFAATWSSKETKAFRITSSINNFDSGGISRWKSTLILTNRVSVERKSSFYDDFEQFNDDDEEDEDDDENNSEIFLTQDDKVRIEMFRSQMMTASGDARNKLSPPDINELDDEEDEENEEDQPNDTEKDTKQESTASFNSVEELISFASGGSQLQNKPRDWAIPLLDYDSSSNFENTSLQMANAIVKALKSGVILIANPEKFCAPSSKDSNSKKKNQPSPSLLSKFGLTLPPPSDLGPDRRADLLPVLILLERHPLRGSKAVLLNRRTGYLLGDLEQPSNNPSSSPPKLGAFMIQPLWFGGTSASAGSTVGGGGLDMLHLCPTVQGCQQLTEDGLFWGGNIIQAQEAMNCKSLERPMTGFDFKFFVQSTRWLPTQLEREVRDGTWFIASVSKEVLFKPRDRLGTMRAKPLWTEIIELMGGQFLSVLNSLYDEA